MKYYVAKITIYDERAYTCHELLMAEDKREAASIIKKEMDEFLEGECLYCVNLHQVKSVEEYYILCKYIV